MTDMPPRTQTYRASHGRRRMPRALHVPAVELGVPTDSAPDPNRNLRAACGCLILIAVAVTGLVCGGALFLAGALLGW